MVRPNPLCCPFGTCQDRDADTPDSASLEQKSDSNSRRRLNPDLDSGSEDVFSLFRSTA